MIEKALRYLMGLKEPHMEIINDRTYSDKELVRVEEEDYARAFEMTTLSSLVEYIKSGVDEMKGEMIVHVESPTRVKVFSQLDYYRKREHVVVVEACLPKVTVDQFVEKEMFNIALQSKFVDNDDKALLLKFSGTVEDKTVAEYGDDGVSQKATIKTGLASKGEAIVPNPVRLKPFRTFTEVDQPESAFVFRMKNDSYAGITCGIFEADGGAWKREAMESVKAYLKEELKDVAGYVIIS